MDRVYAFTDEYGGFGWNLVNPTVSSNYIITAIIVKESWKEPSSSAVDS